MSREQFQSFIDDEYEVVRKVKKVLRKKSILEGIAQHTEETAWLGSDFTVLPEHMINNPNLYICYDKANITEDGCLKISSDTIFKF